MNKPTPILRRGIFLILLSGLTLGIVLYWKDVLNIFASISSVFRPVFIGIVIAFFINLPMRIYERWLMKLLDKTSFKHKEVLCRASGMILSFLSFIAIMALAISLLYPRLRDSVMMLVDRYPDYEERVLSWIETYMPALDLNSRISAEINKLLEAIPDMLKTYVPKLFSITSSAASVVTDSVIALFLSFYFLITKDKLVRQSKTLLKTYLPRLADRILPICTMVNDKFRKFLGGQITEAVILGILCFIGMSILGIPYAPLVSTLIGITAVIPIFGAFIGTIPSAFIILMDNPLQALIFVVFITIVQQIEGNFIYPRVVGDSIGLSGMWVLLAVVIGGGFWGIPGIFIGIPLMSAIYELIHDDVQKRKKEKNFARAEINDKL